MQRIPASDYVHTDLPHIAALIAEGEITVGIVDPVGCVAVATDGHNTLAMLKRRQDEALAQLLTRLDHAIERAWTEEIYTDEINPPASFTFRAAANAKGKPPSTRYSPYAYQGSSGTLLSRRSLRSTASSNER